jgi:hypothetical protein
MTPAVRAQMTYLKWVHDYDGIIDVSLRHAAEHSEDPIDAKATRERLQGMRDGYWRMGFTQRDQLARLTTWEAMLGPDFITSYQGGAAREIIMTSPKAWIAIARIRRFLAGLDDMTPEEMGLG